MKQNQQEKGTGDIKHRTLKDISALSLLLLLSFIISRVVPTYLPLFAFKSCTNLPTYHCSHSTVAQIYQPTIVRIQQLHRSTYLPLFAFNSCTDLPTYHRSHSTDILWSWAWGDCHRMDTYIEGAELSYLVQKFQNLVDYHSKTTLTKSCLNQKAYH